MCSVSEPARAQDRKSELAGQAAVRETPAFVHMPRSAEGSIEIPSVDDAWRWHHATAVQRVPTPIAQRATAADQQRPRYDELSHASALNKSPRISGEIPAIPAPPPLAPRSAILPMPGPPVRGLTGDGEAIDGQKIRSFHNCRRGPALHRISATGLSVLGR
jgi:hypothetical protein